jgi:ankyrin repeat protein
MQRSDRRYKLDPFLYMGAAYLSEHVIQPWLYKGYLHGLSFYRQLTSTNTQDQSFIDRQLYRHLELNGVQDNHLQTLTSEGYCFGHSVFFSAMRITGNLAWHKAGKAHISAWDGQASSRYKQLLLPGAKDNKPISLYTLLERFTHYIVFNFGDMRCYPHLTLYQRTFLLPGGPFELLLPNGDIACIKANYRIAGHFSPDDLIKSLQDDITREAIRDNMCLAHIDHHTIALGFLDGNWTLTDPNDENGDSISSPYLEDIVDIMLRELGDEIAIELACFHELKIAPFAYYDELLDKHAERLVQGTGFGVIAMHCPQLIPYVLNKLEKENKLDDLDLNQINRQDYNRTPLIYIAEHGDTRAISVMLDKGANANQTDSQGCTALMMAAQLGHTKIVKKLLQKNADVSIEAAASVSILRNFAALRHRDQQISKLLKNQGQDALPENVLHFTALHLAVFFGHEQTTALLLSNIDEIKIRLFDYLFLMAEAMDHTEILGLLQAKMIGLMSKVDSPLPSPINPFTLFSFKEEAILQIAPNSQLLTTRYNQGT